MKKILALLVLICGASLLYQCSTDVDLYADYKVLTIVYSVLDTQDDTTWIKVTKAFTGPGNALEMAKNPDSSNFENKLDVRLTGRKNGNDLTPLVFDTLTIKNKRAGDSIFYFPNQLMYYAVGSLDVEATYNLLIVNDGVEITSDTELIPSFSITAPRNFIDFTSNTKTIDWTTASYGKRYEVTYTFNYRELRPGSNDTIDKSMDFYVGMLLSQDTDGGEKMNKLYSGDGFYAQLNTDLEDIPNVQRWAGQVDIYVAAGSQVLQNYLSINEATGTLLTEVPIYTNIRNGTGIMASRYTSSKITKLSTKSLEKLVEDNDLGFKYPVE